MKWLMAIAYRIRQFIWALRAEAHIQQVPDLGDYLNTEQLDLFLRMSRADQRHSLAVWQALKENGATDPFLLQAALLHDVGKTGADLSVWYRVAIVLLESLCPGIVARLAADCPGSWRYPFHVYCQHPSRGAELARAAGALPLVIDLIREHHASSSTTLEPEVAWRLELLHRADRSN